MCETQCNDDERRFGQILMSKRKSDRVSGRSVKLPYQRGSDTTKEADTLIDTGVECVQDEYLS